jgi:hypothetical protein
MTVLLVVGLVLWPLVVGTLIGWVINNILEYIAHRRKIKGYDDSST